MINTIFTNFDNTARLYSHNTIVSTKCVTKTINNNIDQFKRFLNIQLNKYKNKQTDISKIFLVNA